MKVHAREGGGGSKEGDNISSSNLEEERVIYKLSNGTPH